MFIHQGLRVAQAAVKSRKNARKSALFLHIYLLVMPKYWVKNYFAHRRFPEVGQKQKTERKEGKKRDTPRTAGGPGGRDRLLAVKNRKNGQKNTFFSLKNKIYPPFFFAYIF